MNNLTDRDIIERMEVRELIESWVIYRDAADWENFRDVWTEGGRMMATWFYTFALLYLFIIPIFFSFLK